MKTNFLRSRFALVIFGLALGWVARLLLGAPAEETGPAREIDRALTPELETLFDLPILKPNESPGDSKPKNDSDVPPGPSDPELENESGLVPPIQLPWLGGSQVAETQLTFDDFEHDSNTEFEPHGDSLCASGCALSRHPTAELSPSEFRKLSATYAKGPLDETNSALESLLFYGRQTRKLIESEGTGEMDSPHANFLWQALQCTHARISIRVTDEQGEIRTWIDSTRVPFDRRHVFEMKTNDIQPLVTSGTVKRVGLKHLWARL